MFIRLGVVVLPIQHPSGTRRFEMDEKLAEAVFNAKRVVPSDSGVDPLYWEKMCPDPPPDVYRIALAFAPIMYVELVELPWKSLIIQLLAEAPKSSLALPRVVL
jgi:hypothetical protein